MIFVNFVGGDEISVPPTISNPSTKPPTSANSSTTSNKCRFIDKLFLLLFIYGLEISLARPLLATRSCELPSTEIKKDQFRFFLVPWVWVRWKLFFGRNCHSILTSGIFNIRRAPCRYHTKCAHFPYFGHVQNGPNPGSDLEISQNFTNVWDNAS